MKAYYALALAAPFLVAAGDPTETTISGDRILTVTAQGSASIMAMANSSAASAGLRSPMPWMRMVGSAPARSRQTGSAS